MSVETLQTSTLHTAQEAQDEIDLRLYARIIVQWWRQILGTAPAVAVVIMAWYLATDAMRSEVYNASASVTIVRTFSDVSFDPRFRTFSTDMGGETTNSEAARKSALLGLVSNGAIAEAVIAELGDRLAPWQQVPATLMEMVYASSGSNAWDTNRDLITISASAETR